jgi:hypothetical protein
MKEVYLYLHIKSQLELCVKIAVVNLKKAMNELLEVNISLSFEVHH